MILVEKYQKGSDSAHSISSRDQRANYPKMHAEQKRRSPHKLYAPPAAVSNSSARFSTTFFARGDVLTRGLVLAVCLVGVFFGMVTCLDSLAFCRAPPPLRQNHAGLHSPPAAVQSEMRRHKPRRRKRHRQLYGGRCRWPSLWFSPLSLPIRPS